MTRRVIAYFCDECGVELHTGSVCPECRRVLCSIHYFGERTGMRRRKDGLCVKCAAGKAVKNERDQQA